MEVLEAFFVVIGAGVVLSFILKTVSLLKVLFPKFWYPLPEDFFTSMGQWAGEFTCCIHSTLSSHLCIEKKKLKGKCFTVVCGWAHHNKKYLSMCLNNLQKSFQVMCSTQSMIYCLGEWRQISQRDMHKKSNFMHEWITDNVLTRHQIKITQHSHHPSPLYC